jgi:AcrR family transcriptional regulator
MATRPQPRAPRRDAVRNRARLVDAAALAFRDDGLDVGVDEIARRAGLGVATLYRNFTTKDELILAVMERMTDDVGRTAQDALRTGDVALVLARVLSRAMELQHENRGFIAALARRPREHDELRARLSARVVDHLEPLVRRAHAEGALRSDVDAHDLVVVIRMLGAAAISEDAVDQRRYLDVVLRGLSP